MTRLIPILLLFMAAPGWSQIVVEDTNDNVDIGGSYEPAEGTNRAVLWCVGTRDTDGDSMTGNATYDGQPMATDGLECLGAATEVCSGLFRAVEEDLPSTSATLDASVQNGTPTNHQGLALTISGYDQSTPESDTVNAAGTMSWTFDPGVAVTEGGLAVICMASNRGLTEPAGYTPLFSPQTPPDVELFYKMIDEDGTETPTVTTATNGSSRGTLIFLPAAETGPQPEGRPYYYYRRH